MNTCCGQSYYEIIKNNTDIHEITLNDNKLVNNEFGFKNTVTDLYSSYLGKVSINVLTDKSGNNFLFEHKLKIGNSDILIKVIDCKEHNLSHQSRYNLSQLERLDAMKLNLTDNIYYYYLILLVSYQIAKQENRKNDIQEINNKLNQLKTIDNYENYKIKVQNKYPDLLKSNSSNTLLNNKKLRKDFLKHNVPVDILFNVINFLIFLYEKTGIEGVNGQKSLVCLANIDNLDNAFWTGSYMIFGNGKDQFFPLASLDVIGHELSHGLIQGLPNLEYKGHSGALNESFADIIGTMFEFYMYKKYNENENKNDDIMGKSDWLIGEDLDMSGKYLRSMETPENSPQPQPSKYKGRHYLDPNSNIDHGGVHINSGIPNHCFYLLSQSITKEKSFDIFFKCLKKLNKKSDFIEFRDILKEIEPTNLNIVHALDKVGLTCSVTSDVWGKNTQPRFPNQPKRKRNPDNTFPRNKIPRNQNPSPRYPQQLPRYPQQLPRYPQQLPRYPIPFPNFPIPFPNIPNQFPRYPNRVPRYPFPFPQYPFEFS